MFYALEKHALSVNQHWMHEYCCVETKVQSKFQCFGESSKNSKVCGHSSNIPVKALWTDFFAHMVSQDNLWGRPRWATKVSLYCSKSEPKILHVVRKSAVLKNEGGKPWLRIRWLFTSSFHGWKVLSFGQHSTTIPEVHYWGVHLKCVAYSPVLNIWSSQARQKMQLIVSVQSVV